MSKIRAKIRVNSYFCEFTRIFARILLVFLFKKCSYFARIFKKMSSYEELDTLPTYLTSIHDKQCDKFFIRAHFFENTSEIRVLF